MSVRHFHKGDQPAPLNAAQSLYDRARRDSFADSQVYLKLPQPVRDEAVVDAELTDAIAATARLVHALLVAGRPGRAQYELRRALTVQAVIAGLGRIPIGEGTR